ncbi:MAG: carbohydrate kinase family protein [Rudaea sp.]
MSKIIVLGDINADITMPIERYPLPGAEAVAHSLTVRAGGSAANTAVVLARLGFTPRIIARVGVDSWANQVLAELQSAGVDLAAVQRDPSRSTGLTFVPVLPGGERTLFCEPGANRYTDAEEITHEIFRDVSAVHLSGYALLDSPQRKAAWRILELADGRIPVSLDTALEPALRATDEMRWLLPRLSLLILGRREAAALSGRDIPEHAARALVKTGVGIVGLTLGAGGCLLASLEGLYSQPAYNVSTVDATGAGDSFSAAMIGAFILGLSLPASAILASAMGALATTVRGGGASLPGKEDAVRFLQSRVDDRQEGEWVREALSALAAHEPTATRERS